MPEIAGSRRRRNRQYKEEVRRKNFSLFTLYVFLFTCMHFVCALYAYPTAYIFVLSALRTRLFAFLYALYAVNSGVMSSHRAHRELFDAYNAYKFFDRPSKQRNRRNGRIAYTPAETRDDRRSRMGQNNGGQPVRRAMKARKSLLSAITGSGRLFMGCRGMSEYANSRR